MPTYSPSGKRSSELLRLRQGELANEVVNRQFAEHPETAAQYGPAGREKCLQNANDHLSSLADSIHAGDPSLFANYVGWAKVMLGKRGIPPEDLARNLESTRNVVGETLRGEAGALAVEYLNVGLSRLPSLPTEIPSHLLADAPHAQLARAYLRALLEGARHDANRMILAAVTAGLPVFGGSWVWLVGHPMRRQPLSLPTNGT